jgi:hypothetical protein
MFRPYHLLLFCISLSLFGCIGRQAYYVSPLYGINPAYRTVPLKMDSVKAATYANANLSMGAANEGALDRTHSFTGTLSRSHGFGKFSGHYGGGVTLGSYKVNPYDSVGNHSSVNYKAINERAGRYSFGAVGLAGGIHLVSSNRRTEMRFPGFELSLNKEFGKYGDFRDGMPDSAITFINRSRVFGTVGLYMEVIDKLNKNALFGFKIGYGKSFGKGYSRTFREDAFFSDPTGFNFNYLHMNLNLTKGRSTFYAQGNLLRKSVTSLLGMNYKLSKG